MKKSIKDLADKITEEDKAKLEEEIKTAKAELETNDKEKMDKAFENLSNVSQQVFAKVYQNANPTDNGAGAGADCDTEFHQGGDENK